MSSHFSFHFAPLIICLTLHNKASLKKSLILSVSEVNGIKRDDALHSLEIKRNNAFLSLEIEVHFLLCEASLITAECLALSIQKKIRNSRSQCAF